ncbi:hypothetical protein, partial [Roseiarcus sp.]|uniref:hypothetical protein n=1 Tax=Roseiarcus sp. TaxID=1969460 RepID=UPI003F98239B
AAVEDFTGDDVDDCSHERASLLAYSVCGFTPLGRTAKDGRIATPWAGNPHICFLQETIDQSTHW